MTTQFDLQDYLFDLRGYLILKGAVDPAHAQGRERGADARACASFGLRTGTRGYNACMQELQRRAEASRLSSLEEMALTSRIALEGQIMAERARRQRCERDPDRRECRRN